MSSHDLWASHVWLREKRSLTLESTLEWLGLSFIRKLSCELIYLQNTQVQFPTYKVKLHFWGRIVTSVTRTTLSIIYMDSKILFICCEILFIYFFFICFRLYMVPPKKERKKKKHYYYFLVSDYLSVNFTCTQLNRQFE